MSKKVLITDVDNTLFDWVNIWYRSFRAMLAAVERISGVAAENLYPEISSIHQRYRTSEYAFLLEEMPTLKRLYGSDVLAVMAPAIEAFRAARKDSLQLYPDVMRTLLRLSGAGIVIAAYTESMSFYTNYRFRKLGLDRVIDFLYSPHDHEIPANDPAELRKYRPENYLLHKTVHRYTPDRELKPNPDILQSILRDLQAAPEEAIYVGDSLMKDIAMAQEAGVFDVFAEYGAAQHREEYELLRSVTHWSPEDVAREKAIATSGDIKPSFVLKDGFAPVLSLFELEEEHA